MWKYSYDLEPNVESQIEPPSSYSLDNISTLLGHLMFNSSFQVFRLLILVNSDAFEFHQFQITNNQQCQIPQSCTISQSTLNPKSKQFPSSIKCFICKKIAKITCKSICILKWRRTLILLTYIVASFKLWSLTICGFITIHSSEWVSRSS